VSNNYARLVWEVNGNHQADRCSIAGWGCRCPINCAENGLAWMASAAGILAGSTRKVELAQFLLIEISSTISKEEE
jgi:hypothetical protein